MSSPMVWSRRTFLSTLGLAGAGAVLPRVPVAETTPANIHSEPARLLAFAGMFAYNTDNFGLHQICVYRIEDGKWIAADAPLPAERPHGLALHPTLPVLYSVHSTAQHRYLPRGSVSAFSFDSTSGALTRLGEQSLALSATYPEHLAVSPDGRTLLVSASGGGAYNFFALAADGAILPTPYPLKQIGSGPHPLQRAANPRAAVFHSAGLAAYATDLGADRINHITFSGAAGPGTPTIRSCVSLPPGSGPAALALHPSGDFLVVASRLQPALTILPIDPVSGEILAPISHQALDAQSAGPIVLSPSGDRVYLVGAARSGEAQLSTFHLARSTGRLAPLEQTRIHALREPRQLLRLDDRLLLTGAGGIVSIPLAAQTAVAGEPALVLSNRETVSLAIRTG